MPFDGSPITPACLIRRPDVPAIPVSVRADPVDGHVCRLSFTIPAGATLLDIVIEAGFVLALETVAVAIEGHLIDPDLWRRVRPKPGMRVQILPRFAGGGGDSGKAMRTVMMIAIAAAAAWAGGRWPRSTTGRGRSASM